MKERNQQDEIRKNKEMVMRNIHIFPRDIIEKFENDTLE